MTCTVYNPYRQLNLVENATVETDGWTWSRQKDIRFRLDYSLVSPNLDKLVTHAYISDNQLKKMDHRPIHITINFQTSQIQFRATSLRERS